ncbi:MAG: hypothetical protein KKG92_05605 [Gammaproteobacteria bacterium]|nr:hypothetical protein [Gammaproteobacteria bacterium]
MSHRLPHTRHPIIQCGRQHKVLGAHHTSKQIGLGYGRIQIFGGTHKDIPSELIDGFFAPSKRHQIDVSDAQSVGQLFGGVAAPGHFLPQPRYQCSSGRRRRLIGTRCFFAASFGVCLFFSSRHNGPLIRRERKRAFDSIGNAHTIII